MATGGWLCDRGSPRRERPEDHGDVDQAGGKYGLTVLSQKMGLVAISVLAGGMKAEIDCFGWLSRQYEIRPGIIPSRRNILPGK
jgi:hypothetical protein